MRLSLAERTLAAGAGPDRHIADSTWHLSLRQAALALDARAFAGRNVLIRTKGQLPTVLALLALDGAARRILLCPPDVGDEQILEIMATGEVEITLTDADLTAPLRRAASGAAIPSGAMPRLDTEWILFTSGTSGFPKLVQHSLQSLIAPIADGPAGTNPVWSTFYDTRRYGGLQILLRALLTGGSMVLSEADEPVAAFLQRLSTHKVSHISGTPSHWRRVLMSGAAEIIAPSYVRLSGEISDQPILDRLGKTYAQAGIAHAFASTEAGVVFGVTDSRAGFPPAILQPDPSRPEIRIEDGTLRIRSNCTASRYLGTAKRLAKDEEGFVDTDDMVELRDGRYYFCGRREGVVNVGGEKIYPEEVEAVINLHPRVSMSRVWARKSPITGTLIAADVVLTQTTGEDDFDLLRGEILERCRLELRPHKVPVLLKRVSEIAMMTSGKIERRA
jgi:acyl-coenzyme A synthetase/AMP-(fatty) acid ligase